MEEPGDVSRRSFRFHRIVQALQVDASLAHRPAPEVVRQREARRLDYTQPQNPLVVDDSAFLLQVVAWQRHAGVFIWEIVRSFRPAIVVRVVFPGA